MNRRLAAFGAAVALVAFACRAIPSPQDGVLSIGSIILPSPSVVVGDTMRDSLGRAARLQLYAFGLGGEADTLHNQVPSFIVLDSGAHVTPDGYLVGDSVRGAPVRLIGTIADLQTDAVDVNVTAHPDSLAQSTTPIDTVKFDPRDSTLSANYSAALTTQVLTLSAVPPAGVPGVVLHYAITYQPPASDGPVSAVIVDAASHTSFVDTTDANGQASRRVRVRWKAPTLPDSVIVVVTASYAGKPLRGNGAKFVVPIHSLADLSKGP